MTALDTRLERRTTRVLLALLELHAITGRVTVWALRMRLGYSSSSSVWKHLHALRDAGLVEWEPGKHETLRPTVTAEPLEVECPCCSGSGVLTYEPGGWWHGSGVNVQEWPCPACNERGHALAADVNSPAWCGECGLTALCESCQT